MSILQEYEKHTKYFGKERMKAISKYIEKYDLLYSDIIYDKNVWDKFDKWYRTVYNGKYEKSARGNKKI